MGYLSIDEGITRLVFESYGYLDDIKNILALYKLSWNNIVYRANYQELGNSFFLILGLRVSNNRFKRDVETWRGRKETVKSGTEWWCERNLESRRAVNKRYVNQDNDPGCDASNA